MKFKDYQFKDYQKSLFINYMMDSLDFYHVIKKYGVNILDYYEVMFNYATECIVKIEGGHWPTLDKKYLDISYYVILDTDGNEVIIDMDAIYEEWVADWESDYYDEYKQK